MAKSVEASSACSGRILDCYVASPFLKGMCFAAVVALLEACALSASAQKMDVKIIQRQNGETSYSYEPSLRRIKDAVTVPC